MKKKGREVWKIYRYICSCGIEKVIETDSTKEPILGNCKKCGKNNWKGRKNNG